MHCVPLLAPPLWPPLPRDLTGPPGTLCCPWVAMHSVGRSGPAGGPRLMFVQSQICSWEPWHESCRSGGTQRARRPHCSHQAGPPTPAGQEGPGGRVHLSPIAVCHGVNDAASDSPSMERQPTRQRAHLPSVPSTWWLSLYSDFHRSPDLVCMNMCPVHETEACHVDGTDSYVRMHASPMVNTSLYARTCTSCHMDAHISCFKHVSLMCMNTRLVYM